MLSILLTPNAQFEYCVRIFETRGQSRLNGQANEINESTEPNKRAARKMRLIYRLNNNNTLTCQSRLSVEMLGAGLLVSLPESRVEERTKKGEGRLVRIGARVYI
jgi:hypothetical protein